MLLTPSYVTLSIMSFDSAVAMVVKFGKGALLANVTLSLLFDSCQCTQGDFELLGFRFEGAYYYDEALPMGCSGLYFMLSLQVL